MFLATADSQTARQVNPDRLFLASCVALIATAVSFAVIADIMGSLKSHFGLSNTDVGFVAGAATSGFTLSIFALGPFAMRSACAGLSGLRLRPIFRARS